MRLKFSVGRIVIISVALVAGLAVGMLGFGPAIANALFDQSLGPVSVYQKNEDGQTYGSALYATSIDTEPDLISAVGEDGTIGYVRSMDLYGVQPKTPEEALDQMRKADSVIRIPLYAVDGKTVIGTFKIEEGIMTNMIE